MASNLKTVQSDAEYRTEAAAAPSVSRQASRGLPAITAIFHVAAGHDSFVFTGSDTLLGSMVRALQAYGRSVWGAGKGVPSYSVLESKLNKVAEAATSRLERPQDLFSTCA